MSFSITSVVKKYKHIGLQRCEMYYIRREIHTPSKHVTVVLVATTTIIIIFLLFTYLQLDWLAGFYF